MTPVRLAVLGSLTVVALGCANADADGTAPATTVGTPVAAPAPDTAPDTAPRAASATDAPTTTESAVEPLQILVTNDDGIGAPGLDALVTALTALPDVEITVVAPADNQSGTSMSLTEGDLVATPAATASGFDAMAVAGYPADSVRWALEHLDVDIDLVVSGSNSGQNIGDFSMLSGTVGAARYGAQQGIPGVAVSQGFVSDGEIVFGDSVGAAIAWIVDHRRAYGSGAVSLTSVNSPTCPVRVRGVVEVPLGAFDGRDPLEFDCASTLESPVDDVDAFANGFTAITDLPIQM